MNRYKMNVRRKYNGLKFTIFNYQINIKRLNMHNLISHNQLAEWKHFDNKMGEYISDFDTVNDYYNCLIECDDKQSACKRICRDLLE